MRHGKTSFRHESLQDCKTIRNILKSISNGLSEGKLIFSDDEDEIIMEPEGIAESEIDRDAGGRPASYQYPDNLAGGG